MPFLLPILGTIFAGIPAAAIAEPALVAGLASSGVGIASTIDQLVSAGSPSPVPAPTNPTPTTPTITGNPTGAQTAAASTAYSNTQANVGGALTPDYYQQMLALLSGQGNQPGANNAALQALQQIASSGGSSGLTTQPVIGG